MRLRLLFDDPYVLRKSQRSSGLTQSWILLRPGLQTISDLVSYIIDSFDLHFDTLLLSVRIFKLCKDCIYVFYRLWQWDPVWENMRVRNVISCALCTCGILIANFIFHIGFFFEAHIGLLVCYILMNLFSYFVRITSSSDFVFISDGWLCSAFVRIHPHFQG